MILNMEKYTRQYLDRQDEEIEMKAKKEDDDDEDEDEDEKRRTRRMTFLPPMSMISN